MVRPSSFSDVLGKLPDAKQTGDHWTASCPLPGHTTPAKHLTLKDAGDKCLMACHSEREHGYQSLCEYMGFESLAYSQNGSDPQIVASYDYVDADGKLLYQVVRYSPKDFKQRRRDGTEWVWNLKGVGRVLYRLPQVLRAVSEGQRVYIVEGERDADYLSRLGLVATTNSGGAGKWKTTYNEPLRGASVVIIADKDGPGRKHAAEVARSLQGTAASLKILELPDRGEYQVKDVSDWLSAGGTLVELETLVESSPQYRPPERVVEPGGDEQTREVSFLAVDGKLYEQIMTDNGAAFIEYDHEAGSTGTVTHVMHEGVKVIPLSSEEVSLGAIKLPSGVVDYEDTLSLLEQIESHMTRYLDVSAAFRKFASYYVLLSWLYDKFNTLPYLRFIGDTGCGKSRALDVCGGLCYKPCFASGCITPAPIYRMLRKWEGTIILDEADLQNSDEYHEVTKILNCGFERNRPVIRAVKDNPDRLQVLPTFGPKVFATRRRFKDAALEARCLTEIMSETTREDIPATLPRAFYEEQDELRSKLLLFRLRNYAGANQETTFELPGIEPRLRQVSACFASLFASEQDVLDDYRAFIMHHQQELIEQRAATTVGRVVEKLFALIESVTVVTNVTNVTGEELLPISSQEIAEPLNLTPQAVGQILKTLGLVTRVAKVEGRPKRCIVYDAVKLNTLKRRYIPGDTVEDVVTKVTRVTTLWDSTQENVTGERTACSKAAGVCCLADHDNEDCGHEPGACSYLEEV